MNLTIDGSEQFARDVAETTGISTPEQDDLYALEYVATDFVWQYRANNPEEMAQYMASSYTGDGKTFREPGAETVDSSFADVDIYDLKEIREKGSVTYTDKLWSWNGTVRTELGELVYTVIEENGAYKVSDYTFTPAQ